MPAATLVHTAPWLNLLSVDYNGKPYFYVSRRGPGEEVRTDTVTIVPRIGDKLVLLREFRPSVGETIYSFPAGLVDAGETEIEAALRELREETGLRHAPDVTIQCPRAFKSPGLTDENVVMVMVQWHDEDGTVERDLWLDCEGRVDGDEDIEVFLVDKDDADAILEDPSVLMTQEVMLMLLAFCAVD